MAEALDIQRRVLGRAIQSMPRASTTWRVIIRRWADYAAAEPLYRKALDSAIATLGENHQDYAATLNNLAGLYQSMGNYAAAEPLYRQALKIERKVLGEDIRTMPAA